MLTFSGKIENKYELVKNGEYEVILKLEWAKTLSGDACIQCVYQIRPDVEQEFKGRRVYDYIYKDAVSGDFDQRKINALLSVIEDAQHEFEDYDELVQYLNGSLLKVEIGTKAGDPSKGTKDKNTIKWWSSQPTSFKEYTEIKIQNEGSFDSSKVENKTEITDDDLPF